MILEGIVTTLNEDGSANVSPMGPVVDSDMRRFRLRPYQTSTTYLNLKRSGQGVLHVTDDVLLLARAAVGQLDSPPPVVPASAVEGVILEDCCRWYAFEVDSLDDGRERTEIACRVVDSGRVRDFFGFNRAKHAVVEAAILATRVDFLPADEIAQQMRHLRIAVDKTAGPQESEAFTFLEDYLRQRLAVTDRSVV